MVGLTALRVKHFVFLFPLVLHFLLESLFGMFELAPYIVISYVFVVVDVFMRAPNPQQKHSQHPYQKENQHYACAHKQLCRYIVAW